MSDLLHTDSAWVERSVGVALVGVLTAINLAGVKWVVKVQFALLALLALAVLDFLFGSMIGMGIGGEWWAEEWKILISESLKIVSLRGLSIML